MPRIASWDNLPANVRQHLVDRMRERAITLADLNQLRLWIASQPEVPERDWYKDFGSFKICGRGSYPKTFLLANQIAKGEAL
ncbi:MAG: hypothetical protein WBE13_13645 [Candidatus Acidiferrum sp.]